MDPEERESGNEWIEAVNFHIINTLDIIDRCLSAYCMVFSFSHIDSRNTEMGFSLLFAVACFRSIHSFSLPRIRLFCVFLPQCTTHAWPNVSCVMCVVVESANTCHFQNVNKMNYTTWEWTSCIWVCTTWKGHGLVWSGVKHLTGRCEFSYWYDTFVQQRRIPMIEFCCNFSTSHPTRLESCSLSAARTSSKLEEMFDDVISCRSGLRSLFTSWYQLSKYCTLNKKINFST